MGLKTGLYYVKMRPAVEAQTSDSKQIGGGATSTNDKALLAALSADKQAQEQEVTKLIFNPDLDREIYDNFYLKILALTWSPQELDYKIDQENVGKLMPNEIAVLEKVLTFFAVSDALVNANLEESFLDDVEDQVVVYNT